MAGFRKNSRSKAEYARVVKARARALQRDPKDIDPDERRSRERVRARLAEAKPDFAAVLADRELVIANPAYCLDIEAAQSSLERVIQSRCRRYICYHGGILER